MKKDNIIRKPLLTTIVVILVTAAILYIEANTPVISASNLSVRNTSPDKSSYQMAPDFVGIDKWINSEPLKIEKLRGKVVLVDFWTYTCINCIRTFPYLKEWDRKYRDKGLVIVGIHTPEFDFEKKYENVLNAVNEYQLKYPVGQDNEYATWSIYQNRYWPHEYLIDIDGYIRHDQIGEGNYDETEKIIQSLLNERMERQNEQSVIGQGISNPKEAVNVDVNNVGTPEIYFGYQFTRGNFGNQEGLKQGQAVNYKLPSSISPNNVYLGGLWKNNADNMELAGDEGKIILIFHSKSINIVAGSENGSQAFVFLDHTILNGKNKGLDVNLEENKSISNIQDFKLYNLAVADRYGEHVIIIDVAGKGFKIYTFTFG